MVDGEMYIERRKFQRIDKKFKVNYKVIIAEDEAEEIRKSVIKEKGQSEDISLGGIKVEGNMNGKIGDVITTLFLRRVAFSPCLTLLLPALGAEPPIIMCPHRHTM